MKLLIQISLPLLLLTLSCDNASHHHNRNSSSVDTLTKTNVTSDDEDLSMTEPHSKNIDGFNIEYGYVQYDEDKFGFSNPGYMRVFKGDHLLFVDSFKGEGPVDVVTLGQQELAGQKLVFTLNHGTEACDYASHSRYYVSFNDHIYFLKEFYGMTGGDQYASRFYEHILPKDSAGMENSLLIVEGLIFHEHDQPDLFDTTYIKFTNNAFTINKPTDNLDKAK